MKNTFIFAILFISLICILFITNIHTESVKIRYPAVAGEFYPDNNKLLHKMLDNYLDAAPYLNIKDVHGLVAPHAGYIYSALTAAYGYKQIDSNIKTVIILGPSHYKFFYGASIDNVTYYKTPLGLVKLSEKIKDIRKNKIIKYVPDVHNKEHSVEVELPFLQMTLSNFQIIPIVVGEVDPKELSNILIKYIDNETLVVASSDLSHYYSYNTAKKLDSYCIDAIPKLNFSEMKKCEACGKIPIMTLMYIAKKLNWTGKLLNYKNSGDITGNKKRVVGYSSIVFYKEPFTKREKSFLLNLARKNIVNHFKNYKIKEPENISEKLKEMSGCFVTLTENRSLRGCVGYIYPVKPLYMCVIENSINAAFKDKRFSPVSKNETNKIKIEISVLSKPKKVNTIGNKLKNILVPGKYGVILRNGMKSATYLPQVWKQIPNKEQFLNYLCLKGEMKQDCWKDNKTDVYFYEDFSFNDF